MTSIAVILGSTRPGRTGKAVADWVLEELRTRLAGRDIDVELLDLGDFDLPLLDEPLPAGAVSSTEGYAQEHTKRWSQAVTPYDGYVFVTAEYNHGIPGAFKNAFDFLYHEWAHKPVAFVSYGADGGVRAVEQWRQVVANAHMLDLRPVVSLSLFTDFGAAGFAPLERRASELDALADRLAAVLPVAAQLAG